MAKMTKKMSAKIKADTAYDKKHGIKEGSKKDIEMDKKHGVPGYRKGGMVKGCKG